jgi:peptidoglycan hydrolase-like protein with peptidoglycan-binding domain
MPTLRIGSQGPEVERLQRLLNVNPADGDFGPRTADAVREFQKSQGLVADAAVGQRTWDALEKRTSPGGGGSGGGTGSTAPTPPAGGTPPAAPGGSDGPTPQAASSITIQQLRAIFTQAPLKKLEAYLPLLNSAMTEAQINTKMRKAAFLAQVAHESAEFVYMKEQGNRAYFMRMYDITGRRPKKARELGNLAPGEGARYPGRGPIQVRPSASISSITPSSSRRRASPSAPRPGSGATGALMRPPTGASSSASRGSSTGASPITPSASNITTGRSVPCDARDSKQPIEKF